MSITDQLKAWRQRWQPEPLNDNALNENFALTFGTYSGTRVLDYLVATYFVNVLDGGAPGPAHAKLAEHNGQRAVVQDILARVEAGQNPVTENQQPEETFDARAA